jgi:HK97 family phage major capsid protein
MSEELTQTIESLNRAFAEFRAANDERLKAIEQRGHAPADLVAKVEASNSAITDLQTKLEEQQRSIRQVETAQARLQPTSDPVATARERSEARAFFARQRRVPIDEVQVSDQDLATLRAYRPAFLAYLRRGGNNGDQLSPEIRAAMSVGSDPDGGYLVPPDMTGRIAQLVYESSPIRQLATVEQTRSDRKKGRFDLDQAGAGWVGEQSARPTTTTPKLGEYEIPVREQYAQPEVTQQELDDSVIDLEAWLAEKIGARLGRLEATATVSGDGIASPRGFLTYTAGVPSATTWNRIEQVNTGAAGAFAATNPGDVFHDLFGALKAPYHANFTWLMGRRTLAAVRKLKDGQGNYLWEASFQASQPFQLLGHAVVFAEDMPAIAANSLSIAGGDFRAAYSIIDRMGIRLLRDPFTNKPWIRFYTTRRVGGDVVNFEAIKLIRFAA